MAGANAERGGARWVQLGVFQGWGWCGGCRAGNGGGGKVDTVRASLHQPRRRTMLRRIALLGGLLLALTAWLPATGRPVAVRPAQAPPGWSTAAPRDELRPAFAFEPAGGADGKGAWVIRADRREGQHGWW